MTHDTLSVRRRAITGGYADRYESRRASRGADRAYSPRWSDSAVDATWSMLQHESSESQCSADQAMLALLLFGDPLVTPTNTHRNPEHLRLQSTAHTLSCLGLAGQ